LRKNMDILIIGGGGREHALGWKAAQSSLSGKIYFAPGNAGTAALGENIPIDVTDIEALADFAARYLGETGLTLVGPEVPLGLGIADTFRARGLKVFGPGKAGATLETSKAFANHFMEKYGIPTAAYRVCENYDDAMQALETFTFPCWAKADGLAAGKGVVYCADASEAARVMDEMMRGQVFGASGARVVLEENLEGAEVTLLCLTDGDVMIPLASAADYQRAGDGGTGLNTGGMGSVSPAFGYTDGTGDAIASQTLAGLKAEGIDYRGVIFIGLILTASGPKVIEYNARFGDPETEALMLRLDADLIGLMDAVAERRLGAYVLNNPIQWKKEAAVCVVAVSGGYPGAYTTEYAISDIPANTSDAVVFHAGTRMLNGETLTAGGRVLAVTALGADISAARTSAYDLMKAIRFKDMFYRTDIGTDTGGR
jgi:phosphoribosylamine--glycine ligase